MMPQSDLDHLAILYTALERLAERHISVLVDAEIREKIEAAFQPAVDATHAAIQTLYSKQKE